jgi:hypothetical protein
MSFEHPKYKQVGTGIKLHKYSTVFSRDKVSSHKREFDQTDAGEFNENFFLTIRVEGSAKFCQRICEDCFGSDLKSRHLVIWTAAAQAAPAPQIPSWDCGTQEVARSNIEGV